MNTTPLTCALLATDHPYLSEVAKKCATALFDVRYLSRHSRSETAFPEGARSFLKQQGVDILLNFLSPMRVPDDALAGVRRESINFHPGPPAWPGIGAPSYAIFNNEPTFGATAHRMTSVIDGGEIVGVLRFPIFPEDSCDLLHDRALHYSLTLFFDTCHALARDGRLSASGDKWGRPAVTRAEFEAWMTLSDTDSPDTVDRKVRALRHPRFPGPFVNFSGHKFQLPPGR